MLLQFLCVVGCIAWYCSQAQLSCMSCLFSCKAVPGSDGN